MTAQGVLVYGTIGNQLVAPPALYGVGAPTKPAILGQMYFDTSTTPRTGYVWNGSTWATDSSSTGSFTTLTVTGQSTLGATTIVGTTLINASGSAATTIGTGGTGAVNIGNATGNTAVTGVLNVSGNLNLTSVATLISMNGGAATDFIGTATLLAGQATVLNTNIAAGDRIMITRSALNASPALGQLIYTINPGVSFVVDSYDATGVAVATDVSSFTYVIVRQT